jgi:hypothetical protein
MNYILAEKLRTTGRRKRFGDYMKYQVSVTGVFDFGWARQSYENPSQVIDISAHCDPISLARAPCKMAGIYHMTKLNGSCKVCMLCGKEAPHKMLDHYACGTCRAAIIELFLQYADVWHLIAHLHLPRDLCGNIQLVFLEQMGQITRY